MITRSAAILATNLMIEKIGVENFHATVPLLDARLCHVLREVEDQKAFDQRPDNTTTASALLRADCDRQGKLSTPNHSRRWAKSSSPRKFNRHP